MTSIIKLHVISGAMDESPPCYLLQVDEFNFLLDCGWDEKFDMEAAKELKRHVNKIDAVLLSYPDPLHLGMLPYAVGKLGLSCPVYATLPVYKMGQMFMYDLHQSRYNMEDFDLFSLDDVDSAFDRITQLKYNQSAHMKGKGLGLTITPLPAGHMIGGTVWKIAKEGEEDIVYAVDFNHKKERHLNACELERVARPALLLTDALNTTYQQARRRLRDEKFMTAILSTLRGGGSVLVCVDTAGRVLELAHMLDQLWRNRDSGLAAYSLLLLSNLSYNVVEFAKSQIEWMSDKMMRGFEGARNNPFVLRHVSLCHSAGEVLATPGPRLVLASCPDLESGFARDLFLLWAPHSQNTIVLTTRTSPGTLARDLIEQGGDRTIDLTVKRRVKLEGAELEAYNKQAVRLDIVKKEENHGISSDSESDTELEMWVVTGRHDIPVRRDGPRAPACFKDNKRHHPMYPHHEEKHKWDEYGEIIKPEDYRLAEAMEVDGEAQEAPKEAASESDDDVEEVTSIPTKCTVKKVSVAIKATIQFIDFEGRSDGESVLKIVTQLKPRSVIALRGSEAAISVFRKHCEAEGCNRVFTPRRGETVDATTESHIYQVRLTDALLSGLEWRRGAADVELAWLAARIALRPTETHNQAEGEEAEGEARVEVAAGDQTLTLERAAAGEVAPHRAAFVNSLRLAELKAALARQGLAPELGAGVLWCCNGTLAIRRTDAGRVTLEGVLSEEYYKVRELLYDQFAIV